jgi:hypothetical protein
MVCHRDCGFESHQGRGWSVGCECCVLSGRGLCDKLITRPEESYRLWCVCVWPWSLDNEGSPGPLEAVAPWKRKCRIRCSRWHLRYMLSNWTASGVSRSLIRTLFTTQESPVRPYMAGWQFPASELQSSRSLLWQAGKFPRSASASILLHCWSDTPCLTENGT